MNKPELKIIDDRPDWMKAAAYEMDFLRKELDMAKKSVLAAAKRIDNVYKWANTLAENMEKNIK